MHQVVAVPPVLLELLRSLRAKEASLAAKLAMNRAQQRAIVTQICLAGGVAEPVVLDMEMGVCYQTSSAEERGSDAS